MNDDQCPVKNPEAMSKVTTSLRFLSRDAIERRV